MKARRVLKALKIGAIGITAVVVFGFVVMSLWNWLAPAVFGARTIDFWQALAFWSSARSCSEDSTAATAGLWGRRMSARWEQMTPEEREQFRQGMAGLLWPRRRRGRGAGCSRTRVSAVDPQDCWGPRAAEAGKFSLNLQ